MTTKASRVLVVDDDPDIRTIVRLNLGLSGMETDEAANGSEALEKLASDEWDACVLDLAMPQTDGMTALKVLRDNGRLEDLVVVVLSATSSPKRAIEGLELGAHAHLTKPFSPAAVAGVLQELIDLSPDARDARRRSMLSRAGEMERLGMTTV
ncbi:MAG TPA: response regulator [Actinomycetota bacterium]|nr:response regulator [Actinomycetota bacterium]